MMIDRGLEGSFSLTIYRLVLTQAWSVDVGAGEEKVTDTSYLFQDSVSQRAVSDSLTHLPNY